jgi:REP element-mobilizing transposase RayT
MTDDSDRRPAMAPQRRNQSYHKRKLPHIQTGGKTLFVTFVTKHRWVLPESIRQLVMDACLHDDGWKYLLHGCVVMPDHVHLILSPLNDADGAVHSLSEIMNGIKGASAHAVNRALARTGSVWQPERFDHLLRSDESARSKVEYVCANPVRAGLVANEGEYPWLWREWIEGVGRREP